MKNMMFSLAVALGLAGAATGTAINASLTEPLTAPLSGSSYTASGNSLNIALGYAPKPGATLAIVDNTGLNFISGEFTNIAQGGKLDLSYSGNTYHYVANYYGGNGNDLVLVPANQTICAWGANNQGQLGNNIMSNSTIPVMVDSSGGLAGKTVVAVSAGSHHSLALCSDGMVAAWGLNTSGQLGDHSTITSITPVMVDASGILAGKKVVAVSAGDYHSLALCSDGTVVAWGDNQNGALGNGSSTGSSAPVVVYASGVLSTKSVVAISAGGGYSLALCSDGTVAAWGYNSFGQLGDGSGSNSNVPVSVNSVGTLSGKSVVKISAGYYHSLALYSDGTLAAWGYNSYGQLGNMDTTTNYSPVAVDASGVLAGKSVISVSAGSFHSLALCSDGTVAAWGYNTFGQLGINSTDSSSIPRAVDASGAIAGKSLTSIFAGGQHSLALCSDGTLIAWGYNGWGQIGDNTLTSRIVPTALSSSGVLSDRLPTAVSAGLYFSMALVAPVPSKISTLASLSLSHGSLSPAFQGSNTNYTASVPSSVGALTVTPSVANPGATVKVNGTPVASGDSSQSIPLNLGVNTITVTCTAEDGISSTTYTLVVTRTPDAALAGLGLSSGTLSPGFSAVTTQYAACVANSVTSLRVTPTVSDPAAAVHVNGVDVASGTASQPIALQAGSNTILVEVTAQDGITVSTYTLVVYRSAPIDFTFTSGNQAAVTSPGYDATGLEAAVSLGYAPSPGTVLTIIRSTGLGRITGRFTNLAQNQVVTLAYGGISYRFVADYHGGGGSDLVLRWAATKAGAWGLGTSGQLGNNTTVTSNAPVMVQDVGTLRGRTLSALSNATAHSMALCTDGTVYSWGTNAFGRLGNGTTTASKVPLAVSGYGALSGRNAVSVAAGSTYNLALCEDGTLCSWGLNTNGQLGNNTTAQSSIPTSVDQTGVLSGKEIAGIAAGNGQSIVYDSDGKVYTWGANASGQLGIGTTTQSLVPAAVPTSGVLAGRSVVKVAAGLGFCAVLCSDGGVVTWGTNTAGQLGDSSNTQSNSPVAVIGSGILSGRQIVDLAAGGSHCLALCSDGTLVAWGLNASGQLGINSTSNSNVPVAVDASGALSGKTIVSISAGLNHSLARCSDGTVLAWGQGTSGQMGNGGSVASQVPVVVSAGAFSPTDGISLVQSGATASHVLAIAGTADFSSTLSSIALSAGTLGPIFSSGTTSYTATVPNSTTGIAVTAVVSDPNSTVKVNGDVVASGSASSEIPLYVGSNTISIVCTAQDGATATTYTVTVTRLSNISSLASLTLGSGALNPAFSSGTTAYTATVANSTNSITVTPTASDATAAVRVNGSLVASGTASAALPLSIGSNTITIACTAQDGTTSTSYTVTVTRISNVSSLASLSLSSGSLSPAFSGAATSYSANVDGSTSSVNVTPVVTDSKASVKVNGSVVSSGAASPAVPLGVGSNTITVACTAEDGVTATTYTLIVTRARIDQTIDFGALPSVAYGDTPFQLNAAASSGLAVGYASSNPAVATVSGSTVTIAGIGTTTITASQPGDSTYAPATAVSRTLTVSKTKAAVLLFFLNQTYDGNPHPVAAFSTPYGLSMSLTYDGSAAPPVNAGTYTVEATIHDANYQGSATGTLTVAKAAGTVSLGSLAQTHDGSPRTATAVTSPAGLGVAFTYDGSPTAPTAAGTYAVTASITDTNYSGSTSGTLVVGKGTASMTLGSLGQTYDGTQRMASVVTIPPGLSAVCQYNGSSSPPLDAGSYEVEATIDDPNWQGSATGTLVVGRADPRISLASLSQTYDGGERQISATTTPAGIPLSISYDGSPTGPVNAGSYEVVATVDQPNYSGSASGTLIVGKATAAITMNDVVAVEDGTPKSASATTIPGSLDLAYSYDGSDSAAPSAAGRHPVAVTVNDANWQGSSSAWVNIFGHASASMDGGTLDFGSIHVGYAAEHVSTSSLAVSNADGFRLDLAGSAIGADHLALDSVADVAPGQSKPIWARLAAGRGVGLIHESLDYNFSDDSTLSGASGNLSTTTVLLTGQIFSGDMTWNTSGGSWNTAYAWTDDADSAVHAAPGLTSGFTGVDRATFPASASPLNVTLDGVSPSLKHLTLGGNITLQQGSGSTGLTIGGDSASIGASGANSISTPLTLASAQVWTNNGALSIGGAVANGGNTLSLAGTGSTTLGGNLTGAGGLVKTGPGTLVLAANANAFTGPTSVGEGTISLTGTLNTGSNTTSRITVGDTASLNALFKSSGTLTAGCTNAPAIALGSASGSAGALQVTTRQITAASDVWMGCGEGGFAGLRVSGGTFTIATSLIAGKAGDVASLIMSGGSIALGNGALNLSSGTGSQSAAMLAGGTLTATHAANGGAVVGDYGTSTLTLQNSTMTLAGQGLVIARNSGSRGTVNLLSGTLTANRIMGGDGNSNMILNGGTLKASSSAASSFLGGLGSLFIHSGGGTIDAGTANISIPQPMLAPQGQGVTASGLMVSGGGYLETPLVTVSGGGGSGATAAATLDAAGNLSGIVITNPGSGYTESPTFALSGGGNGVTGAISGSALLAANGSGQLTLTGTTGTIDLPASANNTYTGGTQITGGVQVTARSSSSFGTGGITLRQSGASNSTTITLAGGIELANPLTINLAQARNGITSTGGDNRVAGTITLTGGSQPVVLQNNTANTLMTVSGSITGATLINSLSLRGVAGAKGTIAGQVNLGTGSRLENAGAAEWTISRTGGVWPTTSITGSGNLVLGVDEALPGSSVLTSAGSVIATGALDLNGRVQTLAGLNSSNPNLKVGNGSNGSDARLVLANSGTQTFRGVLCDSLGGATRKLEVVLASGTQTLTGANTHTGGITIHGGALVVNGSTAAGCAVNVVAGGLQGTGVVAGAVEVANGGTINPGTAGGTGTLHLGSATIHGTYVCDVTDTACDVLACSGGMNASSGTLSFNVTGSTGEAIYTIATYGEGGAPVFASIQNLPEGYHLDYTEAGLIRLVRTLGYETWVFGTGLDGGNGAPGDNPSGDGIPNLLKFVLNGDPLEPSNHILPHPEASPEGLKFTYVRRRDSVAETTQTVECSSDLVHWTDLVVPSQSEGAFLIEDDAPSPGLQRVTATIPAQGGHVFARLRVNQ